ncbi:unnamed protein product [Effrenium voratum]|nr:unnamed protein product [Effrenium voratum]
MCGGSSAAAAPSGPLVAQFAAVLGRMPGAPTDSAWEGGCGGRGRGVSGDARKQQFVLAPLHSRKALELSFEAPGSTPANTRPAWPARQSRWKEAAGKRRRPATWAAWSRPGGCLVLAASPDGSAFTSGGARRQAPGQAQRGNNPVAPAGAAGNELKPSCRGANVDDRCG